MPIPKTLGLRAIFPKISFPRSGGGSPPLPPPRHEINSTHGSVPSWLRALMALHPFYGRAPMPPCPPSSVPLWAQALMAPRAYGIDLLKARALMGTSPYGPVPLWPHELNGLCLYGQ